MPTSLHGRGGMLYLQGSGATAIKIGSARKWEVKIDRKLDEANAFGDTWEVALEGIRPWSVSVEGNLDTTDRTPYDAAVATSPRKCYLYPDLTNSSNYYYGTVWPKMDVTVGIDNVARYTLDGQGDGAVSIN